MRNIAPAEGRHRLKLWKGVLSNLLTAVAYACNLGIWPQRSTGFRWRFYLRSFLSFLISKWPTALPQERRRGCDTNKSGCDTVHFPVFCCPGWQMGITSSPRPSNGNVINQLHPRGSISPALIQVSCSTSSVLIPFSFKISFFLLSMMGLYALSAHVLWWPLPAIYCNRGVQPSSPHAMSESRTLSQKWPPESHE